MAKGSGSKSRAAIFICGVPRESCCGSSCSVSAGMRGGSDGSRRGHSSPESAFKCMKRYLVSQGYEQVGSRDFAAPNGGPVRVLTKPTRFGAKLRNGKEGTRNRPLGTGSGCVTSC